MCFRHHDKAEFSFSLQSTNPFFVLFCPHINLRAGCAFDHKDSLQMANLGRAPPQELFFTLSGAGDSPWEVGHVQQVIVDLTQRGIFHGEILDIGCGIGDNAIYVAKHSPNVKVTAIDLVRGNHHVPFSTSMQLGPQSD